MIDANYGDVVIWTLKITNNGPNIGTGIKLKDLIPNGLIILNCDDEKYNKKTGIVGHLERRTRIVNTKSGKKRLEIFDSRINLGNLSISVSIFECILKKEINQDRESHGKKPLKEKDKNHQPPCSGGTEE